MSHGNVEIVQGIYDGFARHDSEMPFALYAPNIEFDASRYHCSDSSPSTTVMMESVRCSANS